MAIQKKFLCFLLFCFSIHLLASTEVIKVDGKLYKQTKIISTKGKGGFFSTIFLVQNKHSKFFALKKLNKAFNERYNPSKRNESWRADIDMLEKIQKELPPHSNIIRFFGATTPDKNQNFSVLLEYMKDGDLFDYIYNNKPLSEEKVKPIAKQAVGALQHLHSVRIIHRDIKPENFLVQRGDDQILIKLTDFGVARVLPNSNNLRQLTIVGSPSYMAFEVHTGSYNEKADIWSLGVMLWSFLNNNCLPYNFKSSIEFLTNYMQHFNNYQCSNEARSFLKKLLEVDYNKRSSATELLEDPWLANLRLEATGLNDESILKIKEMLPFSD